MTEEKRRLNEFLSADKSVYLSKDKCAARRAKFRHDKKHLMYRYFRFLRLAEYHYQRAEVLTNQGKKLSCKYHQLKMLKYDRKCNIAGEKAGVELPKFHLEKGVRICHGGTVINGYVDEGCVFHGNNIVGVKRTGADAEKPKLGKRVDVGAGAIIIGDVNIADDCVIGAGAVVTKSFEIPGTIIAGVPAKELSDK